MFLGDLKFAHTILHLDHSLSHKMSLIVMFFLPKGLPGFFSFFSSDDDVTKLVQNDTPLKTYGGQADQVTFSLHDHEQI